MNNIKKAREAAGVTQQFVALSLGVKGASVSNWESGKTKPSTKNLAALAKLLGVSTDQLLSDDGFYPHPQSTPPLVLDGDPVMGWADDRPETQAIARELYAMALNIGATKEDVDAFRNYMLLTKGEQDYINNSMKFLRSQRKEEEGK